MEPKWVNDTALLCGPWQAEISNVGDRWVVEILDPETNKVKLYKRKYKKLSKAKEFVIRKLITYLDSEACKIDDSLEGAENLLSEIQLEQEEDD